MFYIGLIHKDDSSSYGICFPDFPGCISAGDTFEEVMAMGKEALGFHVEAMKDHGYDIPKPRSLAEIEADKDGFWQEDFQDAQIVRVPLVTNFDPPKRVNISINSSLLTAIDQAAKEQGMTRSAFLASAALQHLG
ncbi:type II toxin-antitoxin system HicB family antitoxin [Fretibacter rubidus]|uniref:type II toxin-antitoxin system HicB family antitoxin n=1 Tax=Fretibacter rubidus TaxID=570162 RepID=UPI00352A36C0